jgi:hypothetical protein
MNSRIFPGLAAAFILLAATVHAAPIDRHALVSRHNVELT